MSGSRAILLRLSVQDADIVRTQLQQMGEAGERALARLDAAARNTGGGPGAGGGSIGNLGQAVGQAGFQIQDFATQVAMGQNALTAFGAQASQFLGIFGTGGAIAGAILTVGVLAAQFLSVGRNSEVAQEGIDSFTKSLGDVAREAERVAGLLARVEGRFLSLRERSRVAEMRDIGRDISDLSGRSNDSLLQALGRRQDAARAQQELDELRNMLAQNNRSVAGGGQLSRRDVEAARAQIRDLEGEIRSATRDAENLEREVLRFDAQRLRQEGLLRGLIEDGTNSNPGTPDREPAAGRAGGGAGGASLEDRFLASEALARRTAQAALSRNRDLSSDLDRTTKQIERTEDVTRQLGLTFNSAFEDMISRGRSFSDILKGIEQDLERLIIRQAVTTPLASAANALISPLVGGVTDYVGSFFPRSEIIGPVGAPKFGGYQAAGGDVSPSSWYWVGENGPERFRPDVPGVIEPAGAMGGTVINHSPVFNISGGGGGLTPQQRAEALALAQAANADLVDRINRGGSISRVVGRR